MKKLVGDFVKCTRVFLCKLSVDSSDRYVR